MTRFERTVLVSSGRGHESRMSPVRFGILSMKAANDCSLPALDCSDIPGRRRAKHTAFLDKLKMVTSGVRQTKDALSKINKPKPPKTKQANQALCRVICAKVEPCIRTQLNQLTTALGCEDGCSGQFVGRCLQPS